MAIECVVQMTISARPDMEGATPVSIALPVLPFVDPCKATECVLAALRVSSLDLGDYWEQDVRFIFECLRQHLVEENTIRFKINQIVTDLKTTLVPTCNELRGRLEKLWSDVGDELDFE